MVHLKSLFLSYSYIEWPAAPGIKYHLNGSGEITRTFMPSKIILHTICNACFLPFKAIFRSSIKTCMVVVEEVPRERVPRKST
jgi:hypothetical protein